MDRERHERLGELFGAACELDAPEREAFLARTCDDPSLRAEVLDLLERDARDDRRLSTSDALRGRLVQDALIAAETAAAEAPPERIGAYRLLEKVGEGGMGEVYAADQLEPVRRRVALKLIKRGMDSALVVARFEAERQALALMSHPNVAQVFDGGTTSDGRPYFVMEYVAGEPITEWCDRRKLPTRERIELFLGVCAGMQHAHQKGLVHRDLKPSNLLVAQQDGRSVVKVIDFGVARATSGRLVDRTLHTLTGQVVGTLDYMSPEQADPTNVDVDTRSDIYSLGVVLYQLVSGLLPFDFRAAGELPLSAMQRAIREQDPPTPSKRLGRQGGTATTIASRHGTDERSLVRQLHGDLDWICLHALEKDPARRYATVSEFADDLHRHLAFEPVLAGAPSAAYRARKFVRRHRVGVGAGLLVVGALIVGAWGLVTGRLEAESKTAQVLRLSDTQRIAPLEAEADALWPAVPGKIAALDDWLARARDLTSRLPEHRQTLALLEAATPALVPSARASDASDAPTPTVEQRWQHDLQAELVHSLEVLDATLIADDGVSAAHGRSVSSRLALARDLAAGFADGGAYAQAWDDALPALREAYPGLDPKPQMGLLPLGPDLHSGLWEFAHLPSGAPARRVDGALEIDADTGLVLVLLPGGTFDMGSQSSDPLAPNYVAFPQLQRAMLEAIEPLQRGVPVDPFFVSKYEVTQGHWRRATGSSPSAGEPGDLLPDRPVEMVSWSECSGFCERLGLALPDETQWEYAARGGTSTPWWTGATEDSLHGQENLADRQPWENELGLPEYPFADGTVGLAAVGSFAANPFGLHDVLGNVTEWTTGVRDAEPSPGSTSAGSRVARGGNYLDTRASFGARSAFRMMSGPPEFNVPQLGFRPVRALDP